MKLYIRIVVLMALLILCLSLQDHSNSLAVVNEPEHRHHKGQVEFNASDEIPLGPIATEQERIDTMIRAFRHLPSDEQARIGVDLTKPVEAGSSEADHLHKVWTQRQREYKEAVDSLLKPAEKMKELVQLLQNTSMTAGEKGLEELESILGDIDNSRDFHTIGGWPTLVGMLSPNHPEEHRSLAALAIGTAVKNSYDFQLWTLEKVHQEGKNSPEVDVNSLFKDPNAPQTVTITMEDLMAADKSKSAVDLLVDILWDVADDVKKKSLGSSRGSSCNASSFGENNNDDRLLRRALYAVASSARGNLDVQQALTEATFQFANLPPMSKFLRSIAVLSNPCHYESVEASRKVWAFLEDMLSELEYARSVLLHSEEITEEMRAELRALMPLMIGQQVCGNDDNNSGGATAWLQIAHETIGKLIDRFDAEPLMALFDHPTSSSDDGEVEMEEVKEKSNGIAAAVKPAVTSLLESVNKVISLLENQCEFKDGTIPTVVKSAETADLLGKIRVSTRADHIHKESFHEMNSTYTYSDSQY